MEARLATDLEPRAVPQEHQVLFYPFPLLHVSAMATGKLVCNLGPDGDVLNSFHGNTMFETHLLEPLKGRSCSLYRGCTLSEVA